jgi:hypothetical protein
VFPHHGIAVREKNERLGQKLLSANAEGERFVSDVFPQSFAFGKQIDALAFTRLHGLDGKRLRLVRRVNER